MFGQSERRTFSASTSTVAKDGALQPERNDQAPIRCAGTRLRGEVVRAARVAVEEREQLDAAMRLHERRHARDECGIVEPLHAPLGKSEAFRRMRVVEALDRGP